MKENEIYQIVSILEEEANVLAILLDGKKFDDLDHRVEISVRREVQRLRNLAINLKEIRRESHE